MVKRLDPEQICRVPQLLKEGHNPSSIARLFEVTPAAIRNVIKEERWKHFADEPPGKPDRCPDCGGMVADDTQPCLHCEGVRRAEYRRKYRLIGMA